MIPLRHALIVLACAFVFSAPPILAGGASDEFLRGDVDGNQTYNPLADAVYLLNFGFLAGPPPPCLDAADADDSGAVNALVDGMWILGHGFLGGPPPPHPFPDCGADPTDDDLSCVVIVCP